MAYDDLREFIRALEKHGELKRIPFEVDPDLEITEFADRSVKSGGPALLFEKPKGSDVPVLINAFASMRRMEIALEVSSVDEVAGRISEFLEMRKPEGLIGKLKMLPKLAEMASFFPKIVSSGPCKEVIRRKAIFAEPLSDPAVLAAGRRPLHHPADGVLAQPRHRQAQLRLLPAAGFRRHDHRDALADAQAGRGALPPPARGGRRETHGYRRGDRRRSGDHVLGHPPAAAGSGRDDDRRVPARQAGGDGEVRNLRPGSAGQREIVLEGYVELGELRREGPFGDHTGFYSLDDDYPVFHVTCVTHRKNPIYATTIVGPPPMEDFYMGKAIERIFLPLMRLQLPEIRDIAMPAEGIFHNLILVAIRKSYPGHARKVMHAIWGLGQAMFSKCIVVVDEDVDVQNSSEVAWKALNNIDPERDIQFVLGPVDSLDHSSRLPNYGSKMGVDATKKWPEEGFTRPWPDVIRMPDDVRAASMRCGRKPACSAYVARRLPPNPS